MQSSTNVKMRQFKTMLFVWCEQELVKLSTLQNSKDQKSVESTQRSSADPASIQRYLVPVPGVPAALRCENADVLVLSTSS